MYCKYCGIFLPEGSRFCGHCGRAILPSREAAPSGNLEKTIGAVESPAGGERDRCPFCGAGLPAGAAFCPACGRGAAAPAAKPPRRKRPLLWGMAGIAAVCVLTAGLLYGGRRTSRPEANTVSTPSGAAQSSAQNHVPDPTASAAEQPGAEAPTAGESEAGLSAEQTAALYRNYFYDAFSSSDLVCLADVTHDGTDEMIVVHFFDEEGARIEGYVFTIGADEHIRMIYSRKGSVFHAGGFFNWYIRESDSGFLLGSEDGYFNTGYGHLTFHEYFLSQDGDVQDVDSVSISSEDYDTHDEINAAFDRYEAQAAELKSRLYTIYACPQRGYDTDTIAMYPMDPADVFPQPAESQSVRSRLTDGAGLLSEADAARLLERLNTQSQAMDFDLVIVTANTLNGKSPQEYADDFYDSGSFGYGTEKDGILLLVSTENRDWYITTTGSGIRIFGQDALNELQDSFQGCLSAGDYAGAFDRFLDTVGDILSRQGA